MPRVLIKALPYQGRYGAHFRANSYADVSDEEAKELVDSGLADLVPGEEHRGSPYDTPSEEPSPVIETAMIEAPENAMQERPGPRKARPKSDE